METKSTNNRVKSETPPQRATTNEKTVEEKPTRPAAPEARAAEAEAQAAALEASAATLRGAGLAEKAAELEAEAAQLRKRAAAAVPRPGRRLDELEAFVGRCEGRATKAAEEVASADAVLQETRRKSEAAVKELDEAKQNLQRHRDDLAAASAAAPGRGVAMDTGDAATVPAPDDLAARNAAAEAELLQLREQLRRAAAERDEALAVAAARPAVKPLPIEPDVQELEAKLAKAQAAYAEAGHDGVDASLGAVRARVVADLFGQLADVKRRRTGC